MTNNDILRRVRYIFDFNDDKMIDIFESGGLKITRSVLSDFLRNDEEEGFKDLHNDQLASYLNGLINEKRGKKEGPQPAPEKFLDNNIILTKLKIALNLRTEDIQDIFRLSGKAISKHEVTAFFRNKKQSQFRPVLDQFLRNFMYGLQLKHRGK